VGASPWARDEIDKRIIKQVKNKTSRIIDSEKQVGGYPVIKPFVKNLIPKSGIEKIK